VGVVRIHCKSIARIARDAHDCFVDIRVVFARCALKEDVMNDKPIDLDDRRGTGSQHATDLRRLTALVEADRKALEKRQEALERYLVTLPAQSWEEAADKARYLLGLLEAISGDARVRSLIVAVLADFDRLAGRDP
jgi:hypothetical protein